MKKRHMVWGFFLAITMAACGSAKAPAKPHAAAAHLPAGKSEADIQKSKGETEICLNGSSRILTTEIRQIYNDAVQARKKKDWPTACQGFRDFMNAEGKICETYLPLLQAGIACSYVKDRELCEDVRNYLRRAEKAVNDGTWELVRGKPLDENYFEEMEKAIERVKKRCP